MRLEDKKNQLNANVCATDTWFIYEGLKGVCLTYVSIKGLVIFLYLTVLSKSG